MMNDAIFQTRETRVLSDHVVEKLEQKRTKEKAPDVFEENIKDENLLKEKHI